MLYSRRGLRADCESDVPRSDIDTNDSTSSGVIKVIQRKAGHTAKTQTKEQYRLYQGGDQPRP